MNSIDYNVFNLSLENGLNNHAISSGKDYIILLKSPVGANVQVRLNSNQGDLIPLKENYAIKAKDIKEIFISADIVPGGTITIGQSNSVEGFEIITAPTVNEIEEIGKINSFDTALLDKLDKIINPFELVSQYTISTSSLSLINILTETITDDKIEIHFNGGSVASNYGHFWGRIYAILDNQIVLYFGGSDAYNGVTTPNNKVTIENKKGSVLMIDCIVQGAVVFASATIKRYKKKV